MVLPLKNPPVAPAGMIAGKSPDPQVPVRLARRHLGVIGYGLRVIVS